MPRIRRHILLLVLLILFIPAARAEWRLDILFGTPAADPAKSDQEGYRLAVGGLILFQVTPLSHNKALITAADGVPRAISLPEVRAYAPTPPAGALPAPPERPEFIHNNLSTLYDGLAVLLDNANPETFRNDFRFEATLRLTTQPGRVGHSKAEIITRGQRLLDLELDALFERFLAANPLPPLRAGGAWCDIAIAVVDAPRPRLTVWLQSPRPEGDIYMTMPDSGFLYQEPLGLPPAVRNQVNLTAALEIYRNERREAREQLIKLMAAPEGPLFGTWSIKTGATHKAVAQALSSAPAGEQDPILFLEAWTLAHERRVAQAIRQMQSIAAGAADRVLADEAAFLSLTWNKRLEAKDTVPSIERSPAGGVYVLESALARLDSPRQFPADALAGNLNIIHDILLYHLQRSDRGVLLRSRIGAVAAWLAQAVLEAADRQPAKISRFLSARLTDDQPWVERITFNTGFALLINGHAGEAVEVFRTLLERWPSSPLVPEAAWGMARARWSQKDWEAGADLAWAVVENFSPGSPWDQFRAANQRTAPASAGLENIARGPNEIRRVALRTLRDYYLARSFPKPQPEALASAELAARLLLDTTQTAIDVRPDWLVLGDILWLAGRRNEARIAYQNVALAETEDQLRIIALRALAACLNPDAVRVAESLKDDPQFGAYLAPLRPEKP